MATWLTEIQPKLKKFIEKQDVYFVATAGASGNVNLSPKGLDTLRVMDKDRVVWLNLGGSGNQTERHIAEVNRMTLMFCAMSGPALILRVYGTAVSIGPGDERWNELLNLFPTHPRARQIFDMNVLQVQTSCGFGVPLFDYVSQREKLTVPK